MYYKIFFEAVPRLLFNRDNYTKGNLTIKAKSNRNNIQKTSNVKGNSSVEVLKFNEFRSATLNFCKSTKVSNFIEKCNAATPEGLLLIYIICHRCFTKQT